MAAVPGMVLIFMISIAVMAVSTANAKVKRSVDLAGNGHFRSSNNEFMGHKTKEARRDLGQPELVRLKRFKRSLPEPGLERVKRTDIEGPELERAERTKRTADDNEASLTRNKRIDETVEEMSLSRQKRFKRSVHLNKFNKDSKFNKGGKIKKLAQNAYHMPTVLRMKRGGLAKAADLGKHAKNAYGHEHGNLRDKRHQPNEFDLSKKSSMGDVVARAVERLRRSKRHPKHVAKLHRAKREELQGKRSESAVLNDINRDITRLQRLRRGITHEVIRDVKRQNKARNHNIVKRQQRKLSSP